MSRSRKPSKAFLLIVLVIPVAFLVALLLAAEGDQSTGPNFAVLAALGMVASLAMAIAGRIRTKRMQKSWLLALAANAVVVFVASGLIDFSAFAGGRH